MAKSSVELRTTRLNGVVVVEAPNNRAPPFPSTFKVIVPTRFEPLKKLAEIVETTLVFGWASSPKMVKGFVDVKDSDVRPLVQRTRGAKLSVLGGDPHDDQVVGTVSATRGISNETVSVP